MAAKSKGMKAYVLIETAPGKTKAIRKALGSVSKGAVANLDAVTGPYDFIAVIEGPTLDAIGRPVADRKDHAALRRVLAGERVDGLVDITYAPTTGDDARALLAALGERVGHAIFVSTGRVHDHALPIPYDEDTPRSLYWGEYAKNKIDGEDAYLGSGRPA